MKLLPRFEGRLAPRMLLVLMTLLINMLSRRQQALNIIFFRSHTFTSEIIHFPRNREWPLRAWCGTPRRRTQPSRDGAPRKVFDSFIRSRVRLR